MAATELPVLDPLRLRLTLRNRAALLRRLTGAVGADAASRRPHVVGRVIALWLCSVAALNPGLVCCGIGVGIPERITNEIYFVGVVTGGTSSASRASSPASSGWRSAG